jgi:hypothetical protein
MMPAELGLHVALAYPCLSTLRLGAKSMTHGRIMETPSKVSRYTLKHSAQTLAARGDGGYIHMQTHTHTHAHT